MAKKSYELDALKPNAGKAESYVKFFERLIDEMRKDIEEAVIPRSDSIAMDSEIGELVESSLNAVLSKWSDTFDELSSQQAAKIVADQERDSQLKMRRAARKLKAPPSMTFRAGKLTKRRIRDKSKEITSLVKSIPSEYIDDLQKMIGNYGVATPKLSDIHDMLDSRYKKHKNKAKNLLLDQTRKTFQGLTESRARDAGQNKYKWLHTGGTKNPRSYHKFTLSGEIYTFDDPPIIDKRTGERGHPSDAINCTCIKKIIIEF